MNFGLCYYLFVLTLFVTDLPVSADFKSEFRYAINV